jgi:hypothetical protein
MKPRIDWTINLGHLLSFGGALLMVVSVFVTFKVDMAVMRHDLDIMRQGTTSNTDSIRNLAAVVATQHEDLAVFIASQQAQKRKAPDNE